MTVDVDITVEILMQIREGIRGLDHKIDRARDELKSDIQDVGARVGAVEMRLGTVGKTLVTYVQEHRMLGQFVKGLARRVEKLEAD